MSDFEVNANNEIKYVGKPDDMYSVLEFRGYLQLMDMKPEELLRRAKEYIKNSISYTEEYKGYNVKCEKITISTHLIDEYVEAKGCKRPTMVGKCKIIETENRYTITPNTTYDEYTSSYDEACVGIFLLDVSDLSIAARSRTPDCVDKLPEPYINDDGEVCEAWTLNSDGEVVPMYNYWTLIKEVKQIKYCDGEEVGVVDRAGELYEYPVVILSRFTDGTYTYYGKQTCPSLDLEYLLSERERKDRK